MDLRRRPNLKRRPAGGRLCMKPWGRRLYSRGVRAAPDVGRIVSRRLLLASSRLTRHAAATVDDSDGKDCALFAKTLSWRSPRWRALFRERHCDPANDVSPSRSSADQQGRPEMTRDCFLDASNAFGPSDSHWPFVPGTRNPKTFGLSAFREPGSGSVLASRWIQIFAIAPSVHDPHGMARSE